MLDILHRYSDLSLVVGMLCEPHLFNKCHRHPLHHLIVFTFVCVFDGSVKGLNDGVLNEGRFMFDIYCYTNDAALVIDEF